MVKLSSIGRGESSVRVAKTAPQRPILNGRWGTAQATRRQETRQAKLPVKLFFPMEIFLQCFPTRAAETSPRTRKRMAPAAISFW